MGKLEVHTNKRILEKKIHNLSSNGIYRGTPGANNEKQKEAFETASQNPLLNKQMLEY